MNALKLNLERQIQDKLQAALQLGDRKAEEELFELALKTVPSPGMINNVARIARDKHKYARAIELHQMSVEQAVPIMKPFFMAHVANDYRLWWKNSEAEEWITKAESSLPSLQNMRMNPGQQRNYLRSQRFVAFIRSFIEERKGKLPQAIEAAEKAEAFARKAIQIQLPNETPLSRNWLNNDLGDSATAYYALTLNAGTAGTLTFDSFTGTALMARTVTVSPGVTGILNLPVAIYAPLNVSLPWVNSAYGIRLAYLPYLVLHGPVLGVLKGVLGPVVDEPVSFVRRSGDDCDGATARFHASPSGGGHR